MPESRLERTRKAYQEQPVLALSGNTCQTVYMTEAEWLALPRPVAPSSPAPIEPTAESPWAV